MQRLEGLERNAESIPDSVFMSIGELLIKSNVANFDEGGRPVPWPPNKKGTPTLVGSGKLRDSGVISGVGSEFVEVAWGAGLPYAAIHQFGGTINHPGSSKLQVFQAGGKTVFAHGTRPHQIQIPARRYLRIQDEDAVAILRLLGDYLVRRN